MDVTKSTAIENIFKFDRCRKYLPRYDQKTFLEQMTYTEGQLLDYLPQKFIDEHQNFKSTGNIIKVSFWVVDITFVSFCHKIKLLAKILGDKTWKMFFFKLAAIGFPFSFMDKIEEDAQEQFYKGLYRGAHKFYKRYKQTGDILDLNIKIVLEENETELEKICHLNHFNLVHGLSDIKDQPKAKKVV